MLHYVVEEGQRTLMVRSDGRMEVSYRPAANLARPQ